MQYLYLLPLPFNYVDRSQRANHYAYRVSITVHCMIMLVTVKWILPEYGRRCVSAAASPCCPLYSMLLSRSSVAVVRVSSSDERDDMTCCYQRPLHTRRRVPTLVAGMLQGPLTVLLYQTRNRFKGHSTWVGYLA